MIEQFNLFASADLKKPASIKASKYGVDAFGKGMKNVGILTIDIKDVKVSSDSLPILPLKPIGRLEEKIGTINSKLNLDIHLMIINKISLGYLILSDEKYKFLIKGEGIMVERGIRNLLNDDERKKLKLLKLLGDEPLSLTYLGLVGRLNVPDFSLRPIEPEIYPFCNIIFHDYFRL